MNSSTVNNQLSLQQDRAPAHDALAVAEHLDDQFSGRWIGRGSEILWPPRSLDLATFDNSLWGIVKEEISHLRLTVEPNCHDI